MVYTGAGSLPALFIFRGKWMPVVYLSGDPLLTQAQTLAFGHNARAQTQVGKFDLELQNHYPAALSTFRKQCNTGRIKAGSIWMWRESKPQLAFMVVRESSVGSTRQRFVESVVMTVARDASLYGLTSLAIAPLANAEEWAALKPVLDYWLKAASLAIEVYEHYLPGVPGK